MSTKVRDAEILRLYEDGVRVKLIVQVLNLPSKWIVYRAILRSKRKPQCQNCTLYNELFENAKLRQIIKC